MGFPDPKWSARPWFWRIARRVGTDVLGQPSDGRWRERLAWSNLYKVGPASDRVHGGGNPAEELVNAQRPHAAELLRMEVEELRPALVVVAAGWCWAEDVARRGAWELRPWEGNFVEHVGRLAGVPLVVSKHPQGVRGPDAAKVAEVSAAFAHARGTRS
jgi:hypothetical protein